MPSIKRLAALAVTLATIPALPAATASGAGWTPVASNTTSEITAVEYQSDSRFWFATSTGAIFTRQGGNFVQTRAPGGVRLNDIEFQDNGPVGFAVGNAGQVLRSDDSGATWTAITGIPVSNNNTHQGGAANCNRQDPLGDVYHVRFATNSRVWIFAEGTQLARSQPANAADVGKAGTWVDANTDPGPDGVAYEVNNNDDSCKVGARVYGTGLTDGFFVPGNPDVGYIIDAYFGEVDFTTNNLATAAQVRAAEAGNGTVPQRTLTGDPANPNRFWSVSPASLGKSTTTYTEDAYSTAHQWEIGNPTVRDFPANGPYDVDYNGGTVLSAGDGGAIFNSVDGRTFFYVDAGGALATEGWRAVSLADASHGAVGGTGGQLVVSSDANVTPDVVAPTVTITGPATVPAGQQVTYTANAADAGGSGINPNGFSWNANGLSSPSTSSTQAYSFPSPGYYTITVKAKDNAGNVSDTASFSVNVTDAVKPKVDLDGASNSKKPPLVGGAARRRHGKVTLIVKGSFGIPPGLTAKQVCSTKVLVTIKVKHGHVVTARRIALKTKGAKCTYRKTVTVAAARLLGAKRFDFTVTYLGNAYTASVTKTYRNVKIKG